MGRSSRCSLLFVMTGRRELGALDGMAARGVHHNRASGRVGFGVVAARVVLWRWKGNDLGLLGGLEEGLGSGGVGVTVIHVRAGTFSVVAAGIVVVGSDWLLLSGGLGGVALVVVGALEGRDSELKDSDENVDELGVYLVI